MEIKDLVLPKRLGKSISSTTREPLDLYNHLVSGGDLDSYTREYGDLDIIKRVYFRKKWRELYDLGCYVSAFRGLDRRRRELNDGVGKSIKSFYRLKGGGYIPLIEWTASMWSMVKNVQLKNDGSIKSLQFHDRSKDLEDFMKGTVMRTMEAEGVDDDKILEMKMIGDLDRSG